MLKLILSPIVILYRVIFLKLYGLSGSLGFSLLLLSVFGSTLSLLIGQVFKKYIDREAEIQSILKPQLDKIRLEPNAELRHKRTVALYRRYSYSPLLTLRSALPLFVQLPLLFAAYQMINSLSVFNGQALWIIKDLAAPDRLLMGINVLPILMTAVNVVTASITPTFKFKDKVQAFFIAGIFLILLYNAPAALLVYWTTNNIFFLFRTMFGRRKHQEERGSVSLASTIKLVTKNIDTITSFAIQYFALLTLFYFYQILALEEGYFFKSFLKYIPFLMASGSYFVLQSYTALKRFRQEPGAVISITLMSANVLILLLIGINYLIPVLSMNFQYNQLACFLASMLGLSAFVIGFLTRATTMVPSAVGILQRLAFIGLIVLIPAVHFASVNMDYLLGQYHLVYLVTMLLFACLNYMILSRAHRTESKNRIALSVGIFSFLMVLLPLFRAILKMTSKVDIDFWILFAFLMALSLIIHSKKAWKRLNQVLGILLVIFTISYAYAIISGDGGGRKHKELTLKMKNIVFTEHPNIYMFCYDGMPNERVFKEQNLPFERLKSILDKHNFKLYDDAYSLGAASLNSIGKMLDLTDRPIKSPEGREIYSGNSYVNKILRANGYTSHFLIDNSCTGYNAIIYKHLSEEMFPPRKASSTKSDFFFVLMRGIFQGEMRYDTMGLIALADADIQARKIEIIKEKLPRAFVVNHFHYPGHTQNSGQCLPNEKELWAKKLTISLDQMENDFQTLQEYDPNAIVIAYGDHGSYLSGDCYNLESWKKEDITEDLIWDRIGTMVAIKWPESHRANSFDSVLVTNQDIFPVVFSYMMNDSMPLEFCPSDVFWGLSTAFRTDIGFDKGKIIR